MGSTLQNNRPEAAHAATADVPRRNVAKNMPTMKSRLLGHMRRKWLTPLDALQLVGCLSLSQRAGELEREGHCVLRRWKRLDSGKTVREYRVVSPTKWSA